MVKAMLFDYGGTLDTAARHWFYVLYEGYVHAGCPITADEFRPAYVYAERALARNRYILPTDDFFALLCKKVTLEVEYLIHHGLLKSSKSLDHYKLIEFVALYCEAYARRHVKEATALLSRFSAKYRLVLVSNFYGNLSHILRSYGIAPCFDAIVESAVVGVRKPDPAIYRLGVQAAGVETGECVVIGDSYTKDVLPASQLGCETVWFKGEEWESVTRDETLPTHVITSLRELCEYY